MPFWIHHSASQGPVNLWRKLAYEVGIRLQGIGDRLEHWGLYGESEDEIPF